MKRVLRRLHVSIEVGIVVLAQRMRSFALGTFAEGLLAWNLEVEAEGWVPPVLAPPDVVHVLGEVVVQNKGDSVKFCFN